MRHLFIIALAVALCGGGDVIAAAQDEAAAQEEEAAAPAEDVRASPSFWAVTGVAPDDVLHLRDVPSADSKSLAGIPFNARGLKNFGCRRGELPFDQWVRMNETQRRAANTKWCRVEFRGKQGWVAGRFLKEDPVAAH